MQSRTSRFSGPELALLAPAAERQRLAVITEADREEDEMGLLGAGAMTAWCDVAVEAIPEFEDWHSHEHMPERLAIPGFLRGTRWVAAADGPRYFLLYEVDAFDTLTSQPYLARLNDPTPWSKQMMGYVRNMTRGLCGVSGSFGFGIAQTLLTTRFSPADGRETVLRAWLTQEALPNLPETRGIIAAHLLETRELPNLPQTQEQRIRGGDMTADWVVLVEGYDFESVISLSRTRLSVESLTARSASPAQTTSVYQLAYSLTCQDTAHDG